jgi:DNA repair protein RadC
MTQVSKKNTPPHYVGHRKRLKEKFLKSDPAAFSDYELLELLLFQAIPRKDVKPLAKQLLKEFGDFNQLVNAQRKKILTVENTNEGIFLQFQIVREILNRIFYEQVKNRNVISSWGTLLDYLKFNMSCLKLEQFRVLFLNKKNMLIADEVMATGTIDQTPIYPREIVKKSLFHEAGAIILVHNHPSGSTKPSNSDIDLTTQIVNACNTINVTVHDHVIIGSGDYYSFKSNMLL